ncbi:MAG: DTW domain-containing protein, partial [Fibrobacterales bacterium]|nr:DTW domain-containing protein [Fibrobacterales bacterium]
MGRTRHHDLGPFPGQDRPELLVAPQDRRDGGVQPLTERCLKCWRTRELCLCGKVPSFVSGVRIGILRHPNERRKTIGTAMLAHTCLENSFLLDGIDFSEDRRLRAELERFAPGEVALLFPGPAARPIEESRGTLKCLLVLDGTWNEAKKILHYTKFLQALPRVAFAPAEPSTYRIRKEPRPECVSTIEAIAHSLRALGEREEVSRNLKAAFDLMVERQLAFGHSAPRQKLSMQLREQRLRE